MKSNGLTNLALEFGFSHSYFYTLRIVTNEKYKHLFSFHKDYRKSLLDYIARAKYLESKMSEILYSYEFDTKEYGEIIRENNLTNNKTNITEIYKSESEVVFAMRDEKDYVSLNFRVFKRWEKIVSLFEQRGEI